MKDKRHYLSACSLADEYIYAFGGFFGSTGFALLCSAVSTTVHDDGQEQSRAGVRALRPSLEVLTTASFNRGDD